MYVEGLCLEIQERYEIWKEKGINVDGRCFRRMG